MGHPDVEYRLHREGSLQEKVCLVTGASRGIGRAIALELASHGAAVAITGRDEIALTDVLVELEAVGPPCTSVVADVSQEDDVARLVRQVGARLGAPEALINNAGIAGPTGAFVDIGAEDFEGVFRTNVLGPVLVSRSVLPEMRRRGAGVIVNIGSLAGAGSYPLRSPYSVSKWALEGLTRTMAVELGPDGVRVNSVAPGPVEGERLLAIFEARAASVGDEPENLLEQLSAQIPLRRFVTPEEVARTVAFLVSDGASGITGHSIQVTGGIGV